MAGWILELDRGSGIPWEGNYSSWLEQKEKRLAQEGKEEDNRRKSLAQELEWVRQSPRARQAKSKARLKAYEEMLQQQNEKAADAVSITIPASTPSWLDRTESASCWVGSNLSPVGS